MSPETSSYTLTQQTFDSIPQIGLSLNSPDPFILTEIFRGYYGMNFVTMLPPDAQLRAIAALLALEKTCNPELFIHRPETDHPVHARLGIYKDSVVATTKDDVPTPKETAKAWYTQLDTLTYDEIKSVTNNEIKGIRINTPIADFFLTTDEPKPLGLLSSVQPAKVFPDFLSQVLVTVPREVILQYLSVVAQSLNQA